MRKYGLSFDTKKYYFSYVLGNGNAMGISNFTDCFTAALDDTVTTKNQYYHQTQFIFPLNLFLVHSN